MSNFEHIEVGSNYERLYRILELAVDAVPHISAPSQDNLIEVIETRNMNYYVFSPLDSSGVYRVFYVTVGENPTLDRIEKGSAYVVLKELMARVYRDPNNASKVTHVMRNAPSPLDELFAQKGALGDDIIPFVRNLNGWGIREIKDFLDGMSHVIRQEATASPWGADTVYTNTYDSFSEPEGLDESSETEGIDYADDIPDDYDDVEIGVSDGAELDNVSTSYDDPDEDDQPYYVGDPSSESARKSNRDSLPARLLSIFKRK